MHDLHDLNFKLISVDWFINNGFLLKDKLYFIFTYYWVCRNLFSNKACKCLISSPPKASQLIQKKSKQNLLRWYQTNHCTVRFSFVWDLYFLRVIRNAAELFIKVIALSPECWPSTKRLLSCSLSFLSTVYHKKSFHCALVVMIV